MVFGFRNGRRARPANRRAARRVLEPLERRDLMALVVGPLAFEQDVPFSGRVATFDAGDLQGTIADFTPTITWGDGSPASNIVIVPNGPNAFDVVASKTYEQFGAFPVTVKVAGADNSSIFQAASATVADAPLTPSGPSSFAATAGQVFEGAIGSFQDVNTSSSPSDFSVRIDWGDGQTSIGSVAPSASGQTGTIRYNVVGSHLYAGSGDHAVTASITRTTSGQAITTTATANVLVQPIAARGLTINPTAGATFQGAVATFTDSNASSVASDFIATIKWSQDGAAIPGTVVKTGPLSYEVQGSFDYTEAGSFAITTTIQRVGAAGTSATAQSVANVAPALSASTTNAISATAGRTFSGVVANFNAAIAANGANNLGAADFSATIDWGDGQVGPGVVAVPPGDATGRFVVTGTHEYASAGAFLAKVTITRASDGLTITTETPVRVYAFAGGLDPLSVADQSAGALITSQQLPILSGTAEPRSTIRLSMRRTQGGAPIILGETMTDAAGRWSLMVGPLAEGPFYLYGTATPTSGSPLPTTLLNNGLPIIVDLHPVRPASAVLNARAGRVMVMVGGGRAGADPSWLTQPGSYALVDAEGGVHRPVSVRAARASRGRPGALRPVVLSFARNSLPRDGEFRLDVTSLAGPVSAGIPIASLGVSRGRR